MNFYLEGISKVRSRSIQERNLNWMGSVVLFKQKLDFMFQL